MEAHIDPWELGSSQVNLLFMPIIMHLIMRALTYLMGPYHTIIIFIVKCSLSLVTWSPGFEMLYSNVYSCTVAEALHSIDLLASS